MEELIRKKFEYYPSFLSYGVRKKLKKQKGTKNYKIEDISAINFFKNTLLVRSFAFFYGLLLFSCSIFFPWLSSDFDIPIIINFIFLSIGILSIS
ncbi:MAG: hypothetical protein AYK18_17850 [Theionarchaea archaeon DG-70]|nr:MAG: hypothetical protein AYK18_17850 [Theionarchaea archaeon DG-70]